MVRGLKKLLYNSYIYNVNITIKHLIILVENILVGTKVINYLVSMYRNITIGSNNAS